MANYQIGDRFVVEITDVDENGLGVMYTLNNRVLCGESDIESFEIQELTPLSEFSKEPKLEEPAYIPKDIFDRIKKVSSLLNDLLKVYSDMTDCINNLDTIDDYIEGLSV